MAESERLVCPPSEAARRLGVAPATLRRYAGLYERVFGRLEPGEHGRLYPEEVLERLSAAKVMQEQGRAVSLEQALLMLREGTEPPEAARVAALTLDRPQEAPGELAAILREEIRAAVRAELASEVAELRRLNDYLMGELERRQLADSKPRRRWWQWWR